MGKVRDVSFIFILFLRIHVSNSDATKWVIAVHGCGKKQNNILPFYFFKISKSIFKIHSVLS